MRRAIEKDRSPEALVAGFTCSNSHIVTSSEMRGCSSVGRSFNFSKKIFKAGNIAEAFAKCYWKHGKLRAQSWNVGIATVVHFDKF